MTSTAAAGKVGEKDKIEKRRALGRGLESLLPGPRVVPTAAPAAATQGQNLQSIPNAESGGAVGTRAGAPAPHGQGAGEQQVPHFVRNDNPSEQGGAEGYEYPEQVAQPITIQAQAETRVPGNLVINLAISDIDKNPFQTRYVQDDEALEELSESIKANGVVQPIVVRPGDEDGRYILVLGERRLHASKKAGKTHVPALVRRVSLQQAAEMTIVENLQREDLSPLEQAEAFRVLSTEFKMTQEQIGERVGLSRVSISNPQLPPHLAGCIKSKI